MGPGRYDLWCLGSCLPGKATAKVTRVARGGAARLEEIPATHIGHGAGGGLRRSQDTRHSQGHGTCNMDRHGGEPAASGQEGWGAEGLGRGNQVWGEVASGDWLPGLESLLPSTWGRQPREARGTT